MIKGIFYVLKGIFIWSCFCYLPLGLVILLSICSKTIVDWKIFTLFAIIWLIAVVVMDKQFKKK
jgi:hypothetical protein